MLPFAALASNKLDESEIISTNLHPLKLKDGYILANKLCSNAAVNLTLLV
jgi:hypothetical protein